MKSNGKYSEPFQKQRHAPDMRAISRRRLACVDEIERLRGSGTPSVLVLRAQNLLLPRYWQNANWRARSEILDSVEWLLRLSRTNLQPRASA